MMASIGNLVGAFIWIGLFCGLMLFMAVSIVAVFALIALSCKIEDWIKEHRNAKI